MNAIIYENKTSGTVVLEYHFASAFEKRRLFLDEQEDIRILWTTNTPCSGNWLKALWRCLIGYRTSRKIND